MPPTPEDKARYENALQHIRGINATLAAAVSAKSTAEFGELISLGFGHGAMAGLAPAERDALRALLLCHLALNPMADIRTRLETIRKNFTNQKTHIREAIESFTTNGAVGAGVLAGTAALPFGGEPPGCQTWRGNNKADLGTCWNFVASCAFQAGFISLQKAILEFFGLGAGGPQRAARVLLNNSATNIQDFDTIPRGFVVGFYRCPANGAGGQLTHVAICSRRRMCVGVRQPDSPIGVQECSIAAIVQKMSPPVSGNPPRPPVEVVRVRSANPVGMESR